MDDNRINQQIELRDGRVVGYAEYGPSQGSPILRCAIRAMQIPSGSQGLDAGCGVGLQTLMLAEAVGATGYVTGLDLSPECLASAVDIARKAGLSERTCFRHGDVNHLPFDDDSFDWAWSMDCIGYAPIKPLPLLKELVRVVRPGCRSYRVAFLR